MKAVFYNGKVLVSADKGFKDYVVINGNKIEEVGDDFDPSRFAGYDLVDLDGKMLMAGFTDAHAHPFTSAFQMSQININYESDPTGVIETAREYIEKHPNKEKFFGIGYAEVGFGIEGPNRHMLDAICPDKPVILVGASGHEAFVNTAALKACGIDENTPDPIPGTQFFKRDETGYPTGHLIESGPITQVVLGLQPFVIEEAKETLLKIFDDFASYGITSIDDCGFIPYLKEPAEELLDEMLASGQMKQRIFGSNHINCLEEADAWEEYLNHMRDKYDTDMVRYNTFKIINDGIVEACSASMTEPFEGHDELVMPLIYGEDLRNICVKAASEGFDVHLHGIGDNTVHENLLAAKAIRDAGYDDTIITIAHTQCVLEEDIPKFAEYDVIANTTGVWHYGDPAAYDLIGKRADRMFPMYSIIKCGAKMSLGSDFPGDEYGPQPLNSIETATTRQMLGDPDSPILQPESERLPMDELIKGFTETAVYQVRMDDKLGTIEPGKYADFIILDQNLYEVDPYELRNVKVCMTVMNGEVTYQA